MTEHYTYMDRCRQLARMGSGKVAPNPMVGAVLVHNNRIIGEGYHECFGKAHAEVNCIASVKKEDEALVSQSTLYVSLEPCAHVGKTPPCADLLIRKNIPRVVIGCRDPFAQVNGKGMEKLKAAGIEVTTGILESECNELNKRFFTFHTQHRPYIILKWAQTADGKISGPDLQPSHQRLFISNAQTARLVHKWRSEEMAIMVGTNTALFDDPELTTRHWPGSNPVRLVLDLHLRLPSTLKLFNGSVRTIVFNLHKHEDRPNLLYYQVGEDASIVHQVLNALYTLNIQSMMVEGGSQLLQSFIDEGLWDEARIITNKKLMAGGGLPAPRLEKASIVEQTSLATDVIRYYKPI